MKDFDKKDSVKEREGGSNLDWNANDSANFGNFSLVDFSNSDAGSPGEVDQVVPGWFRGHNDMVIPPPVRPRRVTEFLRPYVLKMHFTNKYVSAQVIHSPTATVASSASSQEKLLRPTLESHRDVAAAAKIGKILGERLLLKEIPAVTVFLKRDQKYHGKVKAVIDSVREAGVKLV